FLRQWLAPTTMETLALVLQSVPQSALIALLVERMNGLRSGATAPVEERTAFERAATLLAEFREGGMASWVQQSGGAAAHHRTLSHSAPGQISGADDCWHMLDMRV